MMEAVIGFAILLGLAFTFVVAMVVALGAVGSNYDASQDFLKGCRKRAAEDAKRFAAEYVHRQPTYADHATLSRAKPPKAKRPAPLRRVR